MLNIKIRQKPSKIFFIKFKHIGRDFFRKLLIIVLNFECVNPEIKIVFHRSLIISASAEKPLM